MSKHTPTFQTMFNKGFPVRSPRNDAYFRSGASWAPLVGHPTFWQKREPSALPKCLQWSKQNSKSQAFSGPGGLRVQSAYNPPAPCLQGSLGVLDPQLNSCLISTPWSPPGSSAQSALPLHPVVPFSYLVSLLFSEIEKSPKRALLCPKEPLKNQKKSVAAFFTQQNTTPFQMLFFWF